VSIDPGPLAPDPAPGPAGLYFPSLPAFVEEYLALTYRRAMSTHSATWCAQWWRHPEAVVRLDALWRAWEHLRLDPATGMSVWLRDHADHHMAVLLSSDGPFHGCSPDKHTARPLAPLACEPPPPELFDVDVLPTAE
jgi:hypothetical protein